MIFKNIPFILRRFARQKLTTSLHIVGLTLGITVCLLIGLFIKYELSFDAYESKANRTYRINIGASLFLIAGAAVILITLLTVSFQSIKAAIANPVKSLRTE